MAAAKVPQYSEATPPSQGFGVVQLRSLEGQIKDLGTPYSEKLSKNWWSSLNRQRERIQEEVEAATCQEQSDILGLAPSRGSLQVSTLHTPHNPARGQILERQQAAL